MEKESQVFLQTKQILRVQSQRRIRLELITKTRTNYGRATQQQSPKSIVAQQCVEELSGVGTLQYWCWKACWSCWSDA